MKAIIMAGGMGTRLGPYTAVLPKPLMPLGDICVLELILRQLKYHGIKEIILAVNYLSHIIKAFVDDGQRLGMNVSYTYETQPLGTAGPMGAVLDDLSEQFLLLNGDLLSTINFTDFLNEHRTQAADVSIATCKRELKSEFGVLDIDSDRNLIAYREKPVYCHTVSMGLYVLSREAVRPYVRPNERLDMPQLITTMIKAERSIYCYDCKDYWLDIGRPDDYAEAQRLFQADRGMFLPKAVDCA